MQCEHKEETNRQPDDTGWGNGERECIKIVMMTFKEIDWSHMTVILLGGRYLSGSDLFIYPLN